MRPGRPPLSVAANQTNRRGRPPVSSLTRWVLAHKRIVVVGWIALTIAGIAASGPASDRLTNDSSVPDTEGWETTLAIARLYDRDSEGSGNPLLPVVTLPAGRT